MDVVAFLPGGRLLGQVDIAGVVGGLVELGLVKGVLGDQARVLKESDDLDGAMALFKGQERVCRERDDQVGLAGCIGDQAMIRKASGDLDLK